MEKLHPRAVWSLFFTRIFIWLVLVFFGVVLTIFSDIFSFDQATLFIISFLNWLLLIFFILLIITYIWAKLTYYFFRYELTNDSLKTEYGIISKTYTSIPYKRIQNVDISRRVIDRFLGLSNLQIYTAGYGADTSEGFLPGVEKNQAEIIRDELIKRADNAKQIL